MLGFRMPLPIRQLLEAAEVAFVALRVDRGRLRLGPRDLVRDLRARGLRRVPRTTAERAHLKRLIRLVDRCFPSGGNCYRRTLIEVAMDRHAATEPLHMGIRTAGGPKSGHAWLGSIPESDGRGPYDADFVA